MKPHNTPTQSPQLVADATTREALQAILADAPANVSTKTLEAALQGLGKIVSDAHVQRIKSQYGTDAIPELSNIVAGKPSIPSSGEKIFVTNPATDEALAMLPISNATDLNPIVKAAVTAQKEWAATPLRERVKVFYKLRDIMECRQDALATLIHLENGKPYANAFAGIGRAIEQIETACALPELLQGKTVGMSEKIRFHSTPEPVGVVAGITPFNFPLMVPMWMVPLAIGAGNAFILKPSEKTPLSAMELSDMLQLAGLPDGIFSIAQGGKEIVEALCDHPDIKRIGFVGSTQVAKAVYTRASAKGKGVAALGGAKNHLIVMPDANPDPEKTARNIVASITGDSGQRCMAASVVLVVGDDSHGIIEQVQDMMKKLEFDKDLGPLISADSLKRNSRYLEQAVKDGATLKLDGRNAKSPSKGHFVGASLLDNVPVESIAACDEIFAPTGVIIRCETLEEALSIENQSPYGNAACIYTNSIDAAHYFEKHASAGMLGHNVGVPVPPFGSFGGWNESNLGIADITGASSLALWTRSKKVTSRPIGENLDRSNLTN